MLEEGGTLLGRYKVVKYIAEGGMQQVFRAHDTSFDRDVALKVPKNSSAERRFERSARVSAQVTHSTVAKTLDYFEEQGRSYLVEELIEGRDLGRALDEDFVYFDPQLASQFLHKLARGVAAAHHAGVFHRDLKPSNIMVSNDASLTVVKITDFGIAKMADQELIEAVEGGDSSITGSQTAMGALPFMAPEMIQTPKLANQPADIWALGAMVYKLLSGEYPFGTGLRAVPAIVAGKLPKKPALFDQKSQFSELGNRLWQLVEAALNKDPAKRPSADQFVEHCSQLCYPDSVRQFGSIVEVRPGKGRWGKISSEQGMIFYHEDSYYGAQPRTGDRVSFAAFPGSPLPRAFPVLPLRTKVA